MSLLVTAAILSAGIAMGRLLPVSTAGVALAATAGVMATAVGLTPSPRFSVNAFALLVTLLIPYAFALRPGSVAADYPARAFTRIAAAFALLGIAQFVAQFAVGQSVAFYLDMNLSPDLLLAGFNNLNELGYRAGIYKANGVFLLEAAFLNQLLCVAVVIELTTTARLRMLILYAAGILVTFSGTGLVMLALIAPAYLVRERRLGMLIAGGGALLLALLFAEPLGLTHFLDRASEFSSDQSSAFARFLSIFYLLDQFVWIDPASTLFGRGPGSVTEHFTTVGYSAFDPSWGKLMYEYGVVGFLAYFAFLIFCVTRAAGSGYMKAALLIQFAILGGYVATTPVHIEFWTLLVWPTVQHVAASARDPDRTLRNAPLVSNRCV